MNKTKTIQAVVVVFAAFLIGYFVGTTKINIALKNYNPVLSVASREPPPGVNVDFSNFWTVWENVENKYYDKTKIDPQKMVNGAIEGMLGALGDPYTVYLPPATNENFKQGLAGEFQGIGAELGMKDKKVIVISPLENSPAQKSGIKPEDTILKVDGASTEGWSLSQAVEKIRGPKGSTVTLNVLHKDAKSGSDIKIIRDTITVKSIDGYVKKVKDIEGIKITNTLKSHENDEVMYLRLSQFGDNTNKEWITLMNKLNLVSSKSPSFAGIVLDLRNNPGGYLSDATFIASEFIKQGETVVIQETGGTRAVMKAERRGLFLTTPLVILINKGSASASEIVSGALSDHKRAKLVGETTFGKGTIQQANDLGGGAGVHITVAKWLTPEGTWVNGKGIEPDVKVSLDSKDPAHDLQLEKAIEELVR